MVKYVSRNIVRTRDGAESRIEERVVIGVGEGLDRTKRTSL